jgi:hypothetical protein
MRKVHELRSRGITILFVSHSTGDVKSLGDRAAWLDHGRLMAIGKTDLVVSKYLSAMAEKDAQYLGHQPVRQVHDHSAPPEVVAEIPNVDHRFGDGRAEILGICVYDKSGRRIQAMEPASAIVVRISARAKANLDRPIVGFMFRNHLGVDFAGTNTAREQYELPPLMAGEVCTIDFYIELPTLYASSFSFSPAIADGTLEHYTIADWIDNAVVLTMDPSEGPIYGQFHFPCRVEVNSKLGAGVSVSD